MLLKSQLGEVLGPVGKGGVVIPHQGINPGQTEEEEIQEVPLERNDYLAMVLGAFWALWPVLAIVAGVVLCVVLFFFR